MTRTQAIKITCVLERPSIAAAREALGRLRAGQVSVQSSRCASLKPARSLPFLGRRAPLDERGSETLRVLVSPRDEEQALAAIAAAARLHQPGRGSIFSEAVEVHSDGGLDLSIDKGALGELSPGDSGRTPLNPGLAGIVCVVQRGQGDTVARSALEMGFSVPALCFGQGMGLRSKLGLLRVTIPAGKEIVLFLVDREDAPEALALAGEIIGVGVPGRGFIYSFPIRKGLADTRIREENGNYGVASMEQVIAAIDQLSGGSGWRRRAAAMGKAPTARGLFSRPSARPKRYSGDIANITLSCADGMAADYLEMAMSLGAGGATLSQIQGLSFKEDPVGSIETRESADLVLPGARAEGIIDSIAAMGFFGPEVRGLVERSPVNCQVSYQSAKA